jgi:hypothetical protein
MDYLLSFPYACYMFISADFFLPELCIYFDVNQNFLLT